VIKMSNYMEAGKTGEFKEGTMKKVMAGDKEVLLARVDDSYYAIGNRCPHMGGDLSTGKLAGNIVTCPRHGSQFDVTNGHNVRWIKGAGMVAVLGKIIKSPRPVPVYPVKIEGEKIFIEV
jgi:3-phenylpropionate/trans-cinnamate dioxygenase ferredoxin subunit